MECIKIFILKLTFMIIVKFIKFKHKHFDSFNKIIYVNILQHFGIFKQHVNQFKKWQDAMAKISFTSNNFWTLDLAKFHF